MKNLPLGIRLVSCLFLENSTRVFCYWTWDKWRSIPITPHSHVICDLQSFSPLKEKGKRENPLQDIDRENYFLSLLKTVPVGILQLVLHLCVISLESLYKSRMRHFLCHSELVTLCSLEEQTPPSSPHRWALQNSASPLWSCAPGWRQVMLSQPRAARTGDSRAGFILKQRVQLRQHPIPHPNAVAKQQNQWQVLLFQTTPPSHSVLVPPANHLIWVRCGSCSWGAALPLPWRMREWIAAESNLWSAYFLLHPLSWLCGGCSGVLRFPLKTFCLGVSNNFIAHKLFFRVGYQRCCHCLGCAGLPSPEVSLSVTLGWDSWWCFGSLYQQ